MVSVSGDLGGNSGVVRPGTCRLLFCLLLLVVVVIIIALFGGGGGCGGRRPPPVPLQPQPPSSLFLMLPPSEDLRGGGCFVNPLHKTLHKTPATLMLIHEAHPGRERGYNQRRRGVHCPPRW